MDLASIFTDEPVASVPIVAIPIEPDIMPGWTEYYVRRSGQVWRVIQKDDEPPTSWEDAAPWV